MHVVGQHNRWLVGPLCIIGREILGLSTVEAGITCWAVNFTTHAGVGSGNRSKGIVKYGSLPALQALDEVVMEWVERAPHGESSSNAVDISGLSEGPSSVLRTLCCQGSRL